MARTIFVLFSLIVAVYCDEISIISSPKSLEFRGNAELESDSLADLFTASLGYSVIHKTNWDGLIVKDPFNTANGVVTVVAEGIDQLQLKGVKTYPLSGSSASFAIDDLLQKTSEHENVAFEVNLKEPSDGYATPLGDLKGSDEKQSVQYLKPKANKEDADFLQQISFINGVADLLTTTTETLPTVTIVRVSFDALFSVHSRASAAITEAIKLLANAVENLELASQKAYKGAVLVAVVATDGEIIRSKRQTKENDETNNPLNLAITYSANYPVIFNIILWFSVVLVFSLLAISMAIATMDPGRDSIIYRMTSTRMKKDN